MSLIHIAIPGGEQRIYDPEEALRLWTEGVIPRESLYWREGMTEWRPAAEYFASQPVPTVPDALPPVVAGQSPSGFVKDPARLTRVLVVLLWIYVAVSGLSGLWSVISLATGRAGQPETDQFSLADLASLLIGLQQGLIVLVTGVVFLMWIHRANRNARGLGAKGMTFTPGWSVGWYFIPIVNLWKPYQAMKEIWQASTNPTSWRSQTPPALLSTWWTLWIINSLLSNMSFRLSMGAHTGPELIASEVVSLLSDLLDIPTGLVAIRLVREIVRLQTHWAAAAAPAAESSCGICRQSKAPSDMIYLNRTWVCAQCKPILLQQIREGATGL